MEPKQCCVECRFHFFDEEKCPNCEAERFVKEYQEEWDRQLRLLELGTGIACNDDFWALWYHDRIQMKNRFRAICQKVAPEIYDWYSGLDLEMNSEQYMVQEPQLDLFEAELPF